MKPDELVSCHGARDGDLRASPEYWDQIRKFGQRYKNFHWPSVCLLLNLLYTHDRLAGHFDKRFRTIGLSHATFSVLIVLSLCENRGLKQKDVSRMLLVSRANVTSLIDHLVRRGLVQRVADCKDRRVWIAKITQKGETLLKSYLPGHYKEVHRLFHSFNRQEKYLLNRLLTRLRQVIG